MPDALIGRLASATLVLALVSCTTAPPAASPTQSPALSSPAASSTGSITPYRWAGFFSQISGRDFKRLTHTLWRYDVMTSKLHKLSSIRGYGGFTVSPSGRFVIVDRRTEAVGPTRIAVLEPGTSRKPFEILRSSRWIPWAAWRADERKIIYMVVLDLPRRDGDPERVSIRSIARTGGSRNEIATFWTAATIVPQGTNADGTKLYWLETGEGGYYGNPTELDLRTGKRRVLASNIGFVLPAPVLDIGRKRIYWVADGSRLMRRSFDGGASARIYSLSKTAVKRHTTINALLVDPSHQRLAFSIRYENQPRARTYIIRASGGGPRLLVDDRRPDWSGPISWLPDGSGVLMTTRCQCSMEPEQRNYLVDPATRAPTYLSTRLAHMSIQGWTAA